VAVYRICLPQVLHDVANSEIDRLDRWRLEVEPLPEGERHPRASGRGEGHYHRWGGGGVKGEAEKNMYIEHRAGKVACLASWRKMTQPGEFCW
jgi:hypothetical protein